MRPRLEVLEDRLMPALSATGFNLTGTEGLPSNGNVATFTDTYSNFPGNYAATINWGDGAVTAGTVVTTGPGAFAVTGSHTYAEEGTYPQLNVHITDAGGASADATPTWNFIASLSQGRYSNAAATDALGRVYDIGGYFTTMNSAISSVERYDPTTGLWSAIASLHTARADAAAAADAQGRIYAIGGLDVNANTLASVERYDPTTGVWTALANLNVARWGLAAATDAQGRIYAIGGTGSTNAALTTVERYDPTTGVWTTLANLNTARGFTSAAADAQGRIYAIGGLTSNDTALASVERYDPATGVWTPLANLSVARGALGAAADTQGRIYAIGGLDTSNNVLTNVERYDPATGGWTAVASLTLPQGLLAAARDGLGRILAIGGYSAGITASVEALQPALAAAVADAPLTAAGASPSAVEGSSFNGTVATFSDANAGAAAADFSASINWGGGNPTAGSIVALPGGGFAVQGSHSFAEEGTQPIQVTISDDGGSQATATAAVQVADAPLSATGVTLAATEGMAASGVVATFSDADPGAVAGDFHATINWGDGHVSAGIIAVSGGGFSVTGINTYAEEGADAIQVTISDTGGSQAIATASAQVADAPLSASMVNLIPSEGLPFSGVVANFSDADPGAFAGDYAATISWGDGAISAGTVVATGPGAFAVTGTHTYAEEGSYSASVFIADAGGANVSAQALWTTAASLITGRSFTGAATDSQGRIYVVGGQDPSGYSLASVERFDPAVGVWTAVASLNTARQGLAVAADSQGRIYAIGGVDANFNFLASVERYDPATGVWTSIASLNSVRAYATAATDAQGRVYVIGGSDANFNFLTSIERYDPTSNTWSLVASLNTPRFQPGAATDAQGRIYAIGGVGPGGGILNSVERYDPASNTWTSIASLGTVSYATAGVADAQGRIYAIGGLTAGSALASVERYDPATGIWSAVSSLSAPRSTLAAARDGQGRLYAIGGIDATGNFNLTTVEVIQPNTALVADAPLIVSGLALSTNAGVPFSGVVASFSDADPGAVAGDFSATINWGDGTTTTATAANGGIAANGFGAFSILGTHTYSQANSYAIHITVTDAGGSSAVATSTAAVASVTSQIALAGPAGVSAGQSFTITVTALDANHNLVPSYRGVVHFTSSDGQALLPADYTFTAADAGVHTFTATLKTAGNQTITATDTGNGALTCSQPVTVTAATASRLVLAAPAASTAGTAFSITVTALDSYGNVASSYVGTIHFTSSDAKAVLPADYTFTSADAGMHTFSVTLKKAGAQTITATDTASGTRTGSAPSTVSPGPVTHLMLTASTSTPKAGAPFTITVTALDAYGNQAPAYRGTIHFSSTDAAAVLPADYPFAAADQGRHSFSVTLNTIGKQTITAADKSKGTIKGSVSVTVQAAAGVFSDVPASLAFEIGAIDLLDVFYATRGQDGVFIGGPME
jgi:hypothetical protein